MTDVRMPDGTIIRNVPDGITQADLQRRYSAHQDRYGGASIGPIPEDQIQTPYESQQATYKQVADEAANVESQVPFFNRPSTSDAARKYGIPALATVVAPGAGLLVGSALAGATSGGVNLAQQTIDNTEQGRAGQPLNYGEAGEDAGYTAAGNLVFGTALKGLGAAARKLFVTPLTPEAQSAADYAKETNPNPLPWLFGKKQEIKPFDLHGGGVGSELVDIAKPPLKAPFPLSSAAPGSRGAAAQNAADIPVLGNLANQKDSNRVVQFLNSNLGTLTPKASPVQEAATQGQQFLRGVLDPGEGALPEVFGAFKQTVGEFTEVPLTTTRDAILKASAALKQRGTTGALARQINTAAKNSTGSMNAGELDDLYRELTNAAKKSGGKGVAEMQQILPAISKDMDAVGKQFGLTFGDDLAKATAVREQYRDLAKIPGLKDLAQSVDDPGKWLTKLFDPSNGKALGKLREMNPDLYHDLADSYVASNLQRFNRPVKDGFGTALDGKALRTWYEQNADKLKLILGAPQAKALDNFSNYAAHVNGAVERASKSNVETALGTAGRLFGTGGVGTGGALLSGPLAPTLVGFTEGGSFALARGLSNPDSWLFKMFTKGVSPSTASFWQKSAQLAGQTGAQAAKPEK